VKTLALNSHLTLPLPKRLFNSHLVGWINVELLSNLGVLDGF
jgi:hypothetical protein